MKSKKSGGNHGGGKNHAEGTSAMPDHGFHNQKFDQRNAPATAHHGIVGVKHQSGTGSSLPQVVKNAGGP